MTNEVLSHSQKARFFLETLCVLYLDNTRYTTFTISEILLLQIFYRILFLIQREWCTVQSNIQNVATVLFITEVSDFGRMGYI
jgi:hypothetical protein